MLTSNIALVSLFAVLGSCIPNDYPAESSPATGDARWVPPASASMIIKRRKGAVDRTVVMAPDSSMLTALIASGGAMSTLTDMAVLASNTIGDGSQHGRYATNTIALYEDPHRSRLVKRDTSLGVKPKLKMFMMGVVAVALVAFSIYKLCRCLGARLSSTYQAHKNAGAVTPVIELQTARIHTPLHAVTRFVSPPQVFSAVSVRAVADQAHLPPMMSSSTIRPNVFTLGSTNLKSRIHGTSGDSLSSVPPPRSVADSGEGRLRTDRD
ncbi:hypothetical protein SeMB42_g05254 [Synchytrium endobioticum]|uniref:Mid2 domain-containing protein n=1 Tax=Synchytrium endobioticum TaxID=286115 RepID=A0A507CSM1_9FUNG|nr:hypothetical protein SeMB42_g05254 [Synchytrium endobioticum]